MNSLQPPIESRLVLVTGLSGSGKSSVANCFEDLGYYVVDNLPLPLLESFLAAPFKQVEGHQRIAVITDVRAPGFANRFPQLIDEVAQGPLNVTLLFLEASDEVLVRRFSETRRPHPLATDRPLIEGIQRERELLAELRGKADLILDTGSWSIHEVRREIYGEFATEPGEKPTMVVSIESFGFKYGAPQGAVLVFDVRFLPNPYFVPELREKTGLNEDVVGFLKQQPAFGEVVDRLTDLLLFLLPYYRRENRSYVSVGIGCTGGKHRSVGTAEQVAKRLEDAGWTVRLSHPHIKR